MLLKVDGLETTFSTGRGTLSALSEVSFVVHERETVCLVGESGSGKSVAALSIMRLIDYEHGSVTSGAIEFQGRDLVALSQAEMNGIRGGEMGMVFQEPMTALNPVLTIGEQIAEIVRLHTERTKREASRDAVEMLELVGISAPDIRAKQYPHQLSGGLRQRVMIAMALACRPRLLIADEPTTSLDVTIQAQILDLLLNLKKELGMSLLLITHDMAVAAEVADQIVVMYAGRVVEEASAIRIFDRPQHPYTRGLLASVPGEASKYTGRLHAIPGSAPVLAEMPAGCRFHPRCGFVREVCRREIPADLVVDGGRVACWRSGDPELAAGSAGPN